AGVSVQRVRVVRLSAAPAPAARRVRRTEVRPLAQIRLAYDDCTRFAQTADDEGVARGLSSYERERARGRLHAVGRGDVVLDEDGHAVQGAAHAPLFALAV